MCNRWLILGSEMLSISCCLITDGLLLYALAGHQWLCSHAPHKLDSGAHSARCAWAMAVHHAVGVSRHRNSGYRPSMVNIMAQGLSIPDPSLSLTYLYIRSEQQLHTTYTTHCTQSDTACVCANTSSWPHTKRRYHSRWTHSWICHRRPTNTVWSFADHH